MKVSLSWLKEYVDVDMPVERLADALTMAGLEVDSITDRYENLNSVKVGEIIAINPHPNADRLKVCQVDAKDGVYNVVCGAPNAAVGMKAPLALVGTVFASGEVLEAAVIRGVASQGMLCSEKELMLGEDASGLMVLPETAVVGTPLPQALGLSDPVLEIDLTPNRADCLGILGIAREVAALFGKTVRRPQVAVAESGPPILDLTSAKVIDPDHCPRYSMRMLSNITVGPSPFWLADRLISIGLRPINNIVDVTNFVMMETGQPLHAFDFDNLEEHRIEVRLAKEGEKFFTLDGKERTLADHMLMICDGKKAVGLAGVMGGLNSEIEDTTTRVLLESACFAPGSIRLTAKRLALPSDAAHRMERGVDPEGTLFACNRAVDLMAQLSGATVHPGAIDEYPGKKPPVVIDLSVAATNRLLGTSLSPEAVAGHLASIDFQAEKTGEDSLKVTCPSFRVDVHQPVDLMEEVARLSGYDAIGATFPQTSGEILPSSPAIRVRDKIRGLMTGLGFSEAVTYSFMAKSAPDRLRLSEDDKRRRMVEILNPLTEEQGVMRTSFVPGLLETMGTNLKAGEKTLRIFETGKVFFHTQQGQLPEEREMAAGLWTGARCPASWHTPETPCDFYDIKGAVEELFNGLKVRGNISFTARPAGDNRYTMPGVCADIFADDQLLGLVGEVHPDVLKTYDLKQPAFIFELDLGCVMPFLPQNPKAGAIPRYPHTFRDLTVIVDRKTESAKMAGTIEAMDEPLVESVLIFAVFEGKPIAAGKKSVSMRITYRSFDQTLEDEQVNRLHKAISDRVISAFFAELPA